MISRRSFLQLSAAAGAGLTWQSAQAEVAWPAATPIRVILPFSAGGASDVLTRFLAVELQKRLKQNFIVDNRTGAGGNIGMSLVHSAPADGYTIASATVGTLAINQYLYPKMDYDPVRDFEYVSLIWQNCNVFVVRADHPAKTVAQFLAWARSKPKGVVYGSAGIGTTPHLAGELFKLRTGIQALHVPFRGAAQSIPALLGGETDFAIDNIASYSALLRAGTVRALAVTAAERWPTMPEIPTMGQAGVPDFIVTSWGAFVLPKGTPAPIVNTLSSTLQAIALDPALQKRFLDSSAKTVGTTPQQTVAFVERERAMWKDVVRLSGAKLE